MTSRPTTRRTRRSAAQSTATVATSATSARSATGPCRWTARTQFKLSGNRAFDNGLSFGVGFNMGSGKPLTALAALAPYDNDSEIPMTPRGEGFETVDGFKTRTPFETQLDMQASYSINAGAARRLHTAGRRLQPVQHPPGDGLQRRR